VKRGSAHLIKKFLNLRPAPPPRILFSGVLVYWNHQAGLFTYNLQESAFFCGLKKETFKTRFINSWRILSRRARDINIHCFLESEWKKVEVIWTNPSTMVANPID
jgi:hypothetical protein